MSVKGNTLVNNLLNNSVNILSHGKKETKKNTKLSILLGQCLVCDLSGKMFFQGNTSMFKSIGKVEDV